MLIVRLASVGSCQDTAGNGRSIAALRVKGKSGFAATQAVFQTRLVRGW